MLGHRNIWLGAATALLLALTATPAAAGQPDRARCIAELGQAGEVGGDVNVKTANFVTGTEGHDVFDEDLTPGIDVICGFGGTDIITDLGGDDIFLGGDGRDLIYWQQWGGAFHGGPGSDFVRQLMGGTFYGGEGDDYVDLYQSGGTFYGGSGDDSVYEYYKGLIVVGLSSGGTFYGEEGNDFVSRLLPAGTFYGGDGEDVVDWLCGGIFHGGPGIDSFNRVCEDEGTFNQD
ncbi:MAG: hypothetical protein M3442_18340 [Chloroflexota bacterium]|nr:hypothetical protein [Chloroflexota bacterium]